MSQGFNTSGQAWLQVHILSFWTPEIGIASQETLPHGAHGLVRDDLECLVHGRPSSGLYSIHVHYCSQSSYSAGLDYILGVLIRDSRSPEMGRGFRELERVQLVLERNYLGSKMVVEGIPDEWHTMYLRTVYLLKRWVHSSKAEELKEEIVNVQTW